MPDKIQSFDLNQQDISAGGGARGENKLVNSIYIISTPHQSMNHQPRYLQHYQTTTKKLTKPNIFISSSYTFQIQYTRNAITGRKKFKLSDMNGEIIQQPKKKRANTSNDPQTNRAYAITRYYNTTKNAKRLHLFTTKSVKVPKLSIFES